MTQSEQNGALLGSYLTGVMLAEIYHTSSKESLIDLLKKAHTRFPITTSESVLKELEELKQSLNVAA
jgi:hypothetical protein